MKLRLRQKGDLFCLGDSGAAIGDWGYLYTRHYVVGMR